MTTCVLFSKMIVVRYFVAGVFNGKYTRCAVICTGKLMGQTNDGIGMITS